MRREKKEERDVEEMGRSRKKEEREQAEENRRVIREAREAAMREGAIKDKAEAAKMERQHALLTAGVAVNPLSQGSGAAGGSSTEEP